MFFMAHFTILKKWSALLLCGMLLTACDKYLDVTPKGFTLLTTVTNYDQWLNDPSLSTLSATRTLNSLSDLTDVPTIPVPAIYPYDLSYLWSAQYATDADIWASHYDKINAYNSVVLGIDQATGGTDEQKRRFKAEARLGRAFEYFYLINEYAKSYDPSTAVSDLGVQIITSDDVAQKVPDRSTVKETYDFITTEIGEAIPDLPYDNNKNRYRGSKAAAYSVLARVYFYARDYKKARENAGLALAGSTSTMMVDYNNITASNQFRALSVRPDAIYARMGETSFYPTVEFMQSHNIRDTRVRLTYLPGTISPQRGASFYFFGGTSYGSFANAGTSVQEMKLIIAEAAARSNELAEALKQLDEVRKNRIQTAYYQPYQSSDPEFVLQRILEERKFEFPGIGLRWFDMRRLDAENRMPAVKRYDARANVIATLAPHSPRYTLQIPDLVLRYNPGMQQNP
jgi:hypothetical protein